MRKTKVMAYWGRVLPPDQTVSKSEWYRLFWDRAQDAAFVVDEDGQVVDINHKAQEMIESLGLELDHLSLQSIAPHFNEVPLNDLFAEVKGTPDGVLIEAAFQGVADPNHRAEFRFHFIPTHDSLSYFAVLVSDQSRQREAEERLQTTRKSLEAQLQQAQKMEALGTLSSGIAHDFNNILASIIGASEVALEYLSEEDRARRYVNTAHRAGMRGKELIRQILSFSRPSLEQVDRVAVQDVLLDSISLMRPAVSPKVVIEYDLGDEELWTQGDRGRLHQVFTNLLTNAVQAVEQSGRIDIQLASVDMRAANLPKDMRALGVILEARRYAVIKVSDTGEGMSPETIAKIYDPFFTTKQSSQGTGLGLSVVLGIVRSHEGHIDVHSTRGQGSTFTVYLPLKETGRVPANVLRETDGPRRGDGQRILLVDDEAWLLDVGVATLELLNYRPESFTSPLEALAVLKQSPDRVDAVITDYWMPQMTGAELAQAVKAISPDLPVLVVTGNADLDRVQQDCGDAANKVMVKPLARDDLSIILDNFWT